MNSTQWISWSPILYILIILVELSHYWNADLGKDICEHWTSGLIFSTLISISALLILWPLNYY